MCVCVHFYNLLCFQKLSLKKEKKEKKSNNNNNNNSSDNTNGDEEVAGPFFIYTSNVRLFYLVE